MRLTYSEQFHLDKEKRRKKLEEKNRRKFRKKRDARKKY